MLKYARHFGQANSLKWSDSNLKKKSNENEMMYMYLMKPKIWPKRFYYVLYSLKLKNHLFKTNLDFPHI